METAPFENQTSRTQSKVTSNFFTMETFQNGNKIACPASAEKLDPLSAGFKLHFATQAELQKHGGVCKACSEKFGKAHKSVMSGSRIEMPVDLNARNIEPNLEHDHVAFDVPGDLIGVVDFPFEEIDGVLESAPEDARQLAGEVIRQIFAYCFCKGSLTAAAAKFAVIGAGLRPDVLSDATQTDLAKRLGLTKAALSKASVKFQDSFGLKFSRSRSLSSRAKMRARRLGGPDRHHHDTKETAT